MIREKVKVLLCGKMVASMKAIGKTANSTELEYLPQKTIKSKKANGSMEEKLDGSNRYRKSEKFGRSTYKFSINK